MQTFITSGLKRLLTAIISVVTVSSVLNTVVLSKAHKMQQDSPEVFFDDFNGTSLDTEKWLVGNKVWGKGNGGVVPDNVSVSDGILRLEAHGDQYTGDVQGINRPDGTRTGAAIATKEYFASGSYEVVARVAPKLGACSAIWTFEYEEYYKGTPEFEQLAPQSEKDYYVVNHEIDIELPGRPSEEVNSDTIGFDYALMNTWRGELRDEYTPNYTHLPFNVNDGEFHTFRFDWHTGEDGEKPRVLFYIDNILLTTTYYNIPTNEGRLWVGVWFPKDWAGQPDFDTIWFEIDSVKITPFHEAGDTPQKETYPNDGWGTIPNKPKQENLILNGDFENSSNDWDLYGGAVIENGKAVLVSGSDTDTIIQKVIVKPGATYCLSADIVTSGIAVDFGVRDYDGRYTELKKAVTHSGRETIVFQVASHMEEIYIFAEVLRYQSTEINQVDNIELYQID